MQSKDKPTCSTDWTNSDGFSKTAASRAFNHYSYHTASAPKVTVLILLLPPAVVHSRRNRSRSLWGNAPVLAMDA